MLEATAFAHRMSRIMVNVAAIAHDEIPKYRACVARLQAQRPLVDGSRQPPEGAD